MGHQPPAALAVSSGSWDIPGNSNREATMDAIARGTATAALTLHSMTLQALVYHGAMTPAEALEFRLR